MTTQPTQPVALIIERHGVRHAGTYTIEHDMITVQYQGKTKTKYVGPAADADRLARVILGELVMEPEHEDPRR